MYPSLQRHYRGFVFMKKYQDRREFNEDMKSYGKGSEICWAVLYSESGDKVAEFKRGYLEAQYF